MAIQGDVDIYARLGAPVGASISADIAAIPGAPTQSQSSNAQNVVTDATAEVKGAYTQMIASTSFAVTNLVLTVGTVSGKILIDIATGAGGAEVDKVIDLYSATLTSAPAVFSFPFTVPIGTRIAIRAANTDSGALTMVMGLETLG